MDNPNAFPATRHDTGMTLRDYFAGQALAGYFAHRTTQHMNAIDCAAYVYAMADAMLAERTKEQSNG